MQSAAVQEKVIITFKATGSAPSLKQHKFKLNKAATVQNLLDFLRKQLNFESSNPLHLYVNSAFQPSPSANIGTLANCFGDKNKLIVNYSTTQAWG